MSRTIEDAIDRFSLIQGQGDGETSACVMTAISWVTGEAWTDTPLCAHPDLSRLAIIANDDDDTSAAQRAEILRAGADGLIDTWWLPGEVIAAAQIRPTPVDGESLPTESNFDQIMRVLGAITRWKVDKQRADLRSANLRYADLRSANLRSADLGYADLGSADLGSANLRSADLGYADLGSANLRYADLRYADLSYADLGFADLSYADLRSANLRSANLRSANLRSANLRSADLSSAYLSSANLRYANLRYANLRSADLSSAYGNSFTVLPAGWHVNEATGLVMSDDEVTA